ncbi:hypothetical protein LO763_19995 [Glycomyces sp. A-F 0318]|uniref:hypothetical protein n=1 Tax=Glycomyces amatae TaxID=2881355 RepID=UPI001E588377|nr:hypothetical protein [Glycomyces amatae]MCD0445896.1 hypothetical protein [Glycomyces amatae]
MNTGLSSTHETATPDMSDPEERALPATYPDPAIIGWIRSEDIEAADIHLRMTITPGDKLVQLWELDGDHPVRWLGNVFRIDAELPVVRLHYRYASRFDRAQHERIARAAARFWKG